MNFTAHCLKRWEERIDPEGQLPIENVFKDAVYIWRGENLDGKAADYYISGDIVFVVNNGTVLTAYKVDYGFGEEIDREVCSRLFDEVLQLNKDIDHESSKVEKECSELKLELDRTNDEIAALLAKVNHLNSKKNRLKERIKELQRGVESLMSVRDCQAKKLVFCVSWKMENIGSGTRNNVKGKNGKK